FRGGVNVAAADVNGDGKADIITGAGETGGPHVKVFNGATGSLIRQFMAYDSRLRSGVFVAAADLNANAKADIVTGAGAAGPSQGFTRGAFVGGLALGTFPGHPLGTFSPATL